MLNTLLSFDLLVTQFVNSLLPHNLFFNFFFSFFSQQGSSILIWLIIIAVLILFEEKRDKKFIIYFLIIFTTTYVTNDLLLKNMFHRPRPTLPPNPYHLIPNVSCPKDFSFPSGHAATAFAAATALSFFDKKRKGFYYLIAFFIGLSRIYLSCHFFFDVIAGGLIGYLITRIILSGIKSHSNKKVTAQIM